jgi:cytochrome c6
MRVILFFAAFLITIAASLPFSNSARAGNADLGEKLFNDHCIICHAGGENAIAPDRDLSKNSLYKYLGSSNDPGVIKSQIINGGKMGMPAFGGKISEEDIDAIAAYVLMKADQGW